MRQKQPKYVVAFAQTADALQAEQLCHTAQLAGRLIPTPREISAGCGLSWCTQPELAEATQAFLQKNGVCTQVCRIVFL